MKRKIKNLIVKIQEYCKLHKKTVENVAYSSSIIVGCVILGLIGFKCTEPKKMTSLDIDTCKERIEKIYKNDFCESVEIINQLEKKGYDVKIDYEKSEIKVSYADKNSEEIIFSKIKNGFISYKVNSSNVKIEQMMATFGLGVGGVWIGPVGIAVVLAIFKSVCYIIEWIKKIAEKIRK